MFDYQNTSVRFVRALCVAIHNTTTIMVFRFCTLNSSWNAVDSRGGSLDSRLQSDPNCIRRCVRGALFVLDLNTLVANFVAATTATTQANHYHVLSACNFTPLSPGYGGDRPHTCIAYHCTLKTFILLLSAGRETEKSLWGTPYMPARSYFLAASATVQCPVRLGFFLFLFRPWNQFFFASRLLVPLLTPSACLALP